MAHSEMPETVDCEPVDAEHDRRDVEFKLDNEPLRPFLKDNNRALSLPRFLSLMLGKHWIDARLLGLLRDVLHVGSTHFLAPVSADVWCIHTAILAAFLPESTASRSEISRYSQGVFVRLSNHVGTVSVRSQNLFCSWWKKARALWKKRESPGRARTFPQR
jgi:hypothetical protein